MRFSSSVITKTPFEVIQLKDELNETVVEIYSMGALMNGFYVFANGHLHNVIDGFATPEAALKEITYGFKSAKLAPFVCRMANGQFTIDGHPYTIGKFYLGDHAIHGLVYDALFDVMNIHADEHACSVGLRYRYAGSDKGYPFPFELLVNWKLETNNKVTVTTTVLHHHASAIPYSDGWHPYFTLGTSVDDCTLQFTGNRQVEFDERLLPTGVTIDDHRFVKGTNLKGIDLDNCFLLNASEPPRCLLKNNLMELYIQPDTAYPYLQVYIPPHRNSIAIENLSSAPDAFNNEMGLLWLKPNQHHIFSTSYTVKSLA
ncbi:MAG: aldose 1-epimerase [Sphingobacteriales bacterium]|uniref:aldose 1-epimerase n=1 Tax=Hydrotalea flava TaxID=714549 RepID=UPI000AE2B8CB|nr:aldose 1-epimerase [Hydrotalea flava]RTL49891.1 MAG: aldose 1-epimerase [Sphingobacteriales bacterium]